MASPRVSRLQPLLALAGFLALWWLAPVAVRYFTHATFYTFQAPAWAGYSHLRDLQQFWILHEHSKDELITAGRDLARQQAALNLQLQQNSALPDELRQLETLLHLPPQQQFRYEVARVIRRDQTAWWQQLVIRKGRQDGIAPGQGVVFGGGVVGRVKEVFSSTAIVELASSPEFRVAANLGDDPRPIIFQGADALPFGTPRGEINDVAPDFLIPASGSIYVVTSSLGGEFPQGFILGSVSHLTTGSNGLFQSGVVDLDPRLSGLREVAVLVPIGSPADNPASP